MNMFKTVTVAMLDERQGALAQKLRNDMDARLDAVRADVAKMVEEQAARAHGAITGVDGRVTHISGTTDAAMQDIRDDVRALRDALDDYRRDELQYRNDLAARTLRGRLARLSRWLRSMAWAAFHRTMVG